MELNTSLDTVLEQSKYQDFVAFTSTLYNDDAEGRVRSEACFEMLDNARKLGIRVVVGDAGSGSKFLKRLKDPSNYPNVTLVHSGKGGKNKDLSMAGERRFTGKIAMEQYKDASYFLWLEPEKADLMKGESIDAILEPMLSGSADVVVPSRISKETLPSQQRDAENRANKRTMDIFDHSGKMRSTITFRDAQRTAYHGDAYSMAMDKGVYSDDSEYDLWFGPKAFTQNAMERYFLSYTGKKWDGNINPALTALLDKRNVVDVPVDFTYPPDQRSLEEDPEQAAKYKQKRRSQYRYILRTIRDMVRDRLAEGTR